MNISLPYLDRLKNGAHFLGALWRTKKVFIMVGFLVVASVAGFAVWSLPSLHPKVLAAGKKVQRLLNMEQDVENSGTGGEVASPTPSLSEITTQLDQRMTAFEQQHQGEKEDLGQLRDQLKNAIAETQKSNDLLQEQQKEWRQTLAGVGVSSEGSASTGTVPVKTSPTSSTAPTSTSKININTATSAQLDSLPGIGPSFAARIIAYRQQKGPFKKIDDIVNVSGIGEKLLEKIRDLIEVS